MWLYLILIAFLWQVGAQLMFNASLVMIANSVHPTKLGTLNGISQAIGSLARAISPVTVSPLLAWSFSEGRKFPTNFYFSFFLNAIFCILLIIVAAFIPKEINIPYLARMEMEEALQKPDLLSPSSSTSPSKTPEITIIEDNRDEK